MSDDLLSPFFSALSFVNESGSQWVTSFLPLFHYSLLPFFSLKKKDMTLLFKLKI